MVFTPTTTSTTQLIVTPPTTVMQAMWQDSGYKSWKACVAALPLGYGGLCSATKNSNGSYDT